MIAGFSMYCASYWTAKGGVLVAASLALQHSLSHAFQVQHWQVPTVKSLCSVYKVVAGKAQAVADFGLDLTPSEETPETTHKGAQFRPQ